MKPEKALSIKQPWAWLVCAGIKDIENRKWRIGRKKAPYYNANYMLEIPCRIYIHASKTLDLTADSFILERLNSEQSVKFNNAKLKGFALGAIIGEVNIVDCVTESISPWFVGKYGFVLKNPVLYENPIPRRGNVGFFEPYIRNY